jgi:hypothetical protein
MADIRPDRLTTCQSERKSVVSRRPSVDIYVLGILGFMSCAFIFIWFVRLLALRPLLAYCASLGW